MQCSRIQVKKLFQGERSSHICHMLLTVRCWPVALQCGDQACWGSGCTNLLELFKREWEEIGVETLSKSLPYRSGENGAAAAEGPREVLFYFVWFLNGTNNSMFRRNTSFLIAGGKDLGARIKLMT